MQLAPRAPSPREPARRTESNIHLLDGSCALAKFAADKQMPIVATLAGEIVESYLHDGRSSKQFHITFTDRLPATPDAAHRIVHARCVSLLPVSRKPVKVTRIEGAIKIDQCVE